MYIDILVLIYYNLIKKQKRKVLYMIKEKANVYQMVTDRIISELEKGMIPWERPWNGIRAGAFNRVSKN